MKKSLSIKWSLLIVFGAIAATIVITYAIMNRVFWSGYYMHNNRDAVKDAYLIVKTMVENGDTGKDELSDAIGAAKTEAGIIVAVQGDADWDFTFLTRQMMSPKERDFLIDRLQKNLLNAPPEDVKVLEKGDYYTLQQVQVREAENVRQYYECYGYMPDEHGNDKKFIISMPLETTYRASRSSNRYVLILSLIILALGGVLIYFFAKRLTKPIVNLSEISKKMTNLDFSERYDGMDRNEIGTLGNNINDLAEQLEKTIGELRIANAGLKKDLSEKEQVDEMRREFISNVSHELKTPIALIQGYAEGLKDVMDSPESFDYYVDVITDESEKMNRMVQKLMTLNQLEFGAAEMSITAFNITEMVKSVVRANGKLIGESDANVTVTGETEINVLGDEFEIEEVITNYLSNALNHLKDPKEIRISVEKQGKTVRTTVFNTGDPIPEDVIDKVWIKFFKVDKARTRAYGGSGIGLSIVKAIIEAHKGQYGVYNTDSGVAFWFELSSEET